MRLRSSKLLTLDPVLLSVCRFLACLANYMRKLVTVSESLNVVEECQWSIQVG